jgi:hypothetical protein
MWTLVLMWISATSSPPAASASLPVLTVPNFESKEACDKAYNVLSGEVTWGPNIKLVGTCVSSK